MKNRPGKRKAFFIALGVFILIVTAVAAFWPGEKEPEYQGQKLSQWLLAYRLGDEAFAAREAIIVIGTNSMPLLVKWASYEPTRFREFLNETLYKVPTSVRYNRIVQWVFTDRAEERSEVALEIFEVLGSRANCAIPDLSRIARKKKHSSAIMCLNSIGEGAFPALAQLANDQQFVDREAVVYWIGTMKNLGTNEPTATKLLCSLASDKDPQIAVAAIYALGLRETNAQPIVGDLIKFLDHRDPRVRDEATNSIHQITPEFFATNGIVVHERIRGCFWRR